MYVDTGVMVKLYLPEPDSEAVQQAMTDVADVTCSELLLAEFQSAVSRKRRERQIDAYAAGEVVDALRRTIAAGEIGIVKLDSAAIEAAARLLARMPDEIPLRTLDAVHLAVCREHHLFPLFTTDGVMQRAAIHLRIPLVKL
jgi:predicted nucleic acid-binding protein